MENKVKRLIDIVLAGVIAGGIIVFMGDSGTNTVTRTSTQDSAINLQSGDILLTTTNNCPPGTTPWTQGHGRHILLSSSSPGTHSGSASSGGGNYPINLPAHTHTFSGSSSHTHTYADAFMQPGRSGGGFSTFTEGMNHPSAGGSLKRTHVSSLTVSGTTGSTGTSSPTILIPPISITPLAVSIRPCLVN